MMKWFRDSGYFQIYTSVGLLSGFIISSYGNWLLSAFIFGGLTLAIGFSIIKSIAEEVKKNPGNENLKAVFYLVAGFYSLPFLFFIMAAIVGLITGW
jgi:hypothetical protein